jgi:hypothetical protein
MKGMSGRTGTRLPGAILVRIARALFNDYVLASAALPAIADLQREVAEAGGDHRRRLHARWRGYLAFWTLVLVAPLMLTAPPGPEAGRAAFPDVIARLNVGAILIVLGAIVGPALLGWLALAAVGGAVVAVAIHTWYGRHPSFIPEPDESREARGPQINFSSTGVAGNVGGLIFAVGSVIIITLAVPSLVWFLCLALLFGGLCGWALLCWHRSHPKSGLPESLNELR